MALAVCEAVGVDRALALAGMRDAAPDAGALHLRRVQLEGKQVTFVNAFSLNDVDSLRSVWGRLERSGCLARPWTVILNCRADRPVRSRAFGQILGGALAADRLILVGEGTRHAYRAAVAAGLDSRQILRWEGHPPSAVLEAVTERIEDNSTVIGAGNYHGTGAALADLFARSVVHVP
jgi:poly-gamma-glutamate synthase PgsB/CapB